MSRSLWTALAAAAIAGVIVCLRGLEPDKEPARPSTTARGTEHVAAPSPPPARATSAPDNADTVSPPHEIAPAPPFGHADPP